jgi:hypothetical protein
MDALALLCNLYGDGPSTLKRLRAAGLDSFAALEDLEPDQLAQILGTNEAAARRFLREARLLLERLADGDLEQEERPPLAPLASGAPLPASEPASETGSAATAPAAQSGPARAERLLEAALPNPAGDRSSAMIDRVLATWRERDAAVGAERDVEFSDRGEPARAQRVAAGEATPQATPCYGTPLRPRLVDGLDRSLCDRLHETGFVTLETLADADALVVARNSGTELTRVLRLQFLARRLMSERGQVESPEPPDVLKPVSRPGTPVRAPRPAPALPKRAELPGAKFSVSETPFGSPASQLSDELDRASRRTHLADPGRTESDEDAGGPFA